MERVFVNLFSNSLDAMPDGGRIEIVARRDDAVVLVEVGDTGPGISSEVRASLFQPFHSRQAERTRPGAGVVASNGARPRRGHVGGCQGRRRCSVLRLRL